MGPDRARLSSEAAKDSHQGLVLSLSEKSVLRALLYYDLFRFPLSSNEVHRLATVSMSRDAALAAIGSVCARGLARRHGEHVLLGGAELVSERAQAEVRAAAVLPLARRRARLIARFPFVRSVAISGSLSKGVFGPHDDVDFFVVTTPGRVFSCRAMLMAFKRIAFLGSHRYFCVNYLMAEDSLALPDRNLFTATEVAWLRPMVGGAHYQALLDANGWVRDVFPNWVPEDTAELAEVPASAAKRGVERLLAGRSGRLLDERVRRAVSARNERRYRDMPRDVFAVAMRAEPAASKHHPGRFQHRTLARFDEAVRGFEARYGTSLSSD
jgi:hypothetical protein